MRKLLLTSPEDWLIAEMLKEWAQKAKEHIGLKLMVGTFDSKTDAQIIAVIGTIAKCRIEDYMDERKHERC